ncbi:DUF72 domain-containing protein [Labrys monachus]|uniref:Uncharacterized protein YecE (DUF72 family) n=1 Tax=Labrys monachus TaxID=217067 RepID=A0ABU0FA37_9HYPH|nr:DUF72 domain-containing protein [Labrys monachus]MDQ0391481.1 uncharacterized protein YecE (DUF72 family) [Labrys monachus]
MTSRPHPGKIRVGVSGWSYPPWRGDFYPKSLRPSQELHFASRALDTIEINATFYRLQRPASFERWHAETPADFSFSVKGPRFVTHILRGRDARTAIANFLASGVLKLAEKLDVILWQFPPGLIFEADAMEAFLSLLPHDTAAAACLAREHDDHISKGVWTETDRVRPLRHAVEIRDDSFRDAAFIAMLRRHRVALVCADTVEWPRLMDVTADFAYCRLHGSKKLYESGYDDAALDRWADRLVAWAQGLPMTDGDFAAAPAADGVMRDVFIFFDNTVKPEAPRNALALAGKIARLAGAGPVRLPEQAEAGPESHRAGSIGRESRR